LRLAGKRNEWLAAGLAMIAGFVDAYGKITYRTYLSFMSGNTTQTGYRTGQGNFALAVPSVLAIVFLVGGSLAGALLVHSAVRRIRRLIFGMVASLLVLIIGFTRLDIVSDGVGIAVISFAMGAMNAALPRVGAQSVSLAFVTGTLMGIAVHLALAVRHAPVASQNLIHARSKVPETRGGDPSDHLAIDVNFERFLEIGNRFVQPFETSLGHCEASATSRPSLLNQPDSGWKLRPASSNAAASSATLPASVSQRASLCRFSERSCLEEMVSDLPGAFVDGTRLEPRDRVGDPRMQLL
jgi:uncharacterized membrane protein YoaK (UPF0700 family)